MSHVDTPQNHEQYTHQCYNQFWQMFLWILLIFLYRWKRNAIHLMTHKDTTADDSWFTIMASLLGLQPDSWWHHCRWYGQLPIMTSLLMVMGLQPDSLIPRPFPPPVFYHLQYANMEGEGLRDLVMCGDVR